MKLKVVQAFGVLGLIAGTTLLTFSVNPAAAEDGARSPNAENTFTKWVTDSPPPQGVLAEMAGVVGGDVGRGAFTGEVLALTGAGSPENPAFIHAHYHFNGKHHSFTADVHVTQILNKAVIIGVVIDGWLEGNLVEGQYTQITCTHDQPPVTTDCFRGTLDILRGTSP